ncbi:MAG: acyl-CoA dehydrogenase [Candidatus Abyssobacteria bacterium SURF_17]|uniref:3-methylmercaptopropionyl-CoA dehydrogenase n=1 Tax=Candidatus Abyssobacteria bacterium SURF_17 TaxID=2093361 RepID=A0A419EZW3_9BACT|nr:MAG: acyl-CoA dehydrogenase [Candidatus Abyssubacteria bacterium SURF_17]
MGNNYYRINKRDVDFVLNEQLKVEQLCELEKYKDFSRDDFDMIVSEAIKFAQEVLGPLNQDSDREAARYEKGGDVKVPTEFHKAYKLACENGWIAMSNSPEWGGQGLPGVIAMASAEIFFGACTSFMLYFGGPGVAHMVENFGPDKLRNLYCERLYKGEWGGTMCLTEPQAGSAVGDIRTSAKKDGDTYLITGTKCFITAGNHDLTKNIIHGVLARVEGAPPGTKGISQFIVPKYWVNDDGTEGKSNNVTCAGIEHKMGIKGSATCTLNFGEDGPCRGYLLGDEENKGMRQMFQMMNEARISTGLQGIALAAAAFENAVQYSQERIQGVDVKAMRDPNAPRVPIIKHSDVRRMLLLQKSYAEGMRAFAFRLAMYDDLAHGHPDEEKRNFYQGFVDLMTPIIKAYCSDMAFDMTSMAMQCYGGYGYCQEYPVEQYCRDARIAMIFEGTNFIQAADLIGRKLNIGGGALMQSYMANFDEAIGAIKGKPKVADLAEKLDAAKNILLETTMKIAGFAMEGDLDYVMSIATRYLHMFGEIVIGRELVEQAALASEKMEKLAPDSIDYAFYSGKVHAARFFVNNILPGVEMKAKIIENKDRSCIEIPENAFSV